MYQNYCPCYLHLYVAYFLTNCLQNARDAASDNPFFSNFFGGEYPQIPLRARACGARYFAPEALIRTPSKSPGYGPGHVYVSFSVKTNQQN